MKMTKQSNTVRQVVASRAARRGVYALGIFLFYFGFWGYD